MFVLVFVSRPHQVPSLKRMSGPISALAAADFCLLDMTAGETAAFTALKRRKELLSTKNKL